VTDEETVGSSRSSCGVGVCNWVCDDNRGGETRSQEETRCNPKDRTAETAETGETGSEGAAKDQDQERGAEAEKVAIRDDGLKAPVSLVGAFLYGGRAMRCLLVFVVVVAVLGCKTTPRKEQPQENTTPQAKPAQKQSQKQPSEPTKTEPSQKEPVKPPKQTPQSLFEQFKAAYEAARKAHEAYYRVRLLQRRFDEELLNDALAKVEEAFKLASSIVGERPEEPFVREAHTWLGQARFALKEERQQHQRLKQTEAETGKLLKEGKESKIKAKAEVKPKPAPKQK